MKCKDISFQTVNWNFVGYTGQHCEFEISTDTTTVVFTPTETRPSEAHPTETRPSETLPCVPVNDCTAHFTCNNDDSRKCLQGWTGENCDQQIPNSAADCTIYDCKTDFVLTRSFQAGTLRRNKVVSSSMWRLASMLVRRVVKTAYARWVLNDADFVKFCWQEKHLTKYCRAFCKHISKQCRPGVWPSSVLV